MREMLKKFANKGTRNKADHAKFRRLSKARIKLSGYTNAAAKNRVPPGLEEAVARVQRRVWRNLNGKVD